MGRHILSVLMSFAAAIISAAIFIFALIHQFALMEVVASVVTGFQFFLLSAAIADLLERKKAPSRVRNSAVVLVTLFLVTFYSVTRYLH